VHYGKYWYFRLDNFFEHDKILPKIEKNAIHDLSNLKMSICIIETGKIFNIRFYNIEDDFFVKPGKNSSEHTVFMVTKILKSQASFSI